MSTHGLIIIQVKNANIAAWRNELYKAAHVWFDGYPWGLGKTLRSHYTTRKAVNSLIALGNLRTVGPELEKCEKLTDYPDEDKLIMAGNDVNEIINSHSPDFTYIFTPKDKWMIAKVVKTYTFEDFSTDIPAGLLRRERIDLV